MAVAVVMTMSENVEEQKRKTRPKRDTAEKLRRVASRASHVHESGETGMRGLAFVGERAGQLSLPNVLHDDLDGSSDTFFFNRAGFA